MLNVVRVGKHGGEFPCLAETRAKETWDLLNQTVRRQEGVVTLGWGRERERSGRGGGTEREREQEREGGRLGRKLSPVKSSQ